VFPVIGHQYLQTLHQPSGDYSISLKVSTQQLEKTSNYIIANRNTIEVNNAIHSDKFVLGSHYHKGFIDYGIPTNSSIDKKSVPNPQLIKEILAEKDGTGYPKISSDHPSQRLFICIFHITNIMYLIELDSYQLPYWNSNRQDNKPLP